MCSGIFKGIMISASAVNAEYLSNFSTPEPETNVFVLFTEEVWYTVDEKLFVLLKFIYFVLREDRFVLSLK